MFGFGRRLFGRAASIFQEVLMNVPNKQFRVASHLLIIVVTVLFSLSLYSSRAITLAQSGTPAATQCASVTDSDTTIKIGASVPITGKYASGGMQIQNGYLLGIADVNKAGGVQIGCQRMKLELTIIDDASDSTKTVQNMDTLNSSNQVVAYLGGFGSDLHVAAAAIAEKNKTPYIGVAFAVWGVHQKGFKYLFSPFPKSPTLLHSAFDMMDSLSPKPTNVGIFAEKTD